jgi:hypothetical protein
MAVKHFRALIIDEATMSSKVERVTTLPENAMPYYDIREKSKKEATIYVLMRLADGTMIQAPMPKSLVRRY